MSRRFYFILSLVLMVAFGVHLVAPNEDAQEAVLTSAKESVLDEEAKVKVAQDYGKLPLHFEPNVGQTDEQVDFVSRGQGYALFLTEGEAVLALTQLSDDETENIRSDVVRIQLVNANMSPKVRGVEPLSGKSNYLLGNDSSKWHTDVPHYAKVEYRDVYPGIDLVYYGTEQRLLEHDFVVSPGADPNSIRFTVDGAEDVVLDDEGNLIASTDGGDVVLRAPVTYQDIDGERVTVESRYEFIGGGVGFKLASYDVEHKVVIDPVLSYSTYLGGSGWDQGEDIDIDNSGNAFVTGYTASTNFPLQSAYQSTNGGGSFDGFVSVLDSTGSGLIYSTYLGGTGAESGYSIVVNGVGNAFVTGNTGSTDFPLQSAFQSTNGGSDDIFVSVLNSVGSGLVYSTYLGGNGTDFGYSIALDNLGNAFLTGRTTSSNFPLQSAFQSANGGSHDAFVSVLNNTGSGLIYSTYLGGSGTEFGQGIDVDASGKAFITGFTGSTDFPVQSAYQSTKAGGTYDVFISAFNAVGSGLIYSTYLGGSDSERGSDIAVDNSGNAFVIGRTASSNFPLMSALQLANNGSDDLFVSVLNNAGSNLVYSTYLGGIGTDRGQGIGLDNSGNAIVVGETQSINFPLELALQTNNNGSSDIFFTKIFHIIDSTPPVVTSITRLDSNPTNADSVRFQIVFSEPVSGVDGGDLQISVGGAMSVTGGAVSGSDSLYTFSVTINSGNGTLRIDVLDNNTIVDAAGNPLGGAGVQNFTSGESYNIDNTDPVVNVTAPLDDAVDVSLSTDLVVSFSDSVIKGTGNITLKRVSDNVSVDVIDVTSGNVGVNNNIVTATVNATLDEGAEYYVLIDSTAFYDEAGNNYAGISSVSVWNFTTETLAIPMSIADTTARYNTTVDIPIKIETDVTGKGIVASEISVSYRKGIVLSAVTNLTTTAGTVTTNSMVYQGWSVEENVFPGASVDTLKIAMSTAQDTLSGQGDFIYITLQVADVRQPDSTALALVNILFNDGTPAATSTDGSLKLIGTDAAISASPDSIRPSETVNITLDDVDLDLDVGSVDQVSVTAFSVTYGDSQSVTLTETGANTGEFTGFVSTEFSAIAGAPQDGVIGTIAGDSIGVVAIDALTSAGTTAPLYASPVPVYGGQDGVVQFSYVVQAYDGRDGVRDTVRVQVTDADLDLDVGLAESVSATITNAISGELESVLLTETDVNTGVFQVRVPTISGVSGTNNDGVLSLASWDTLTVEYVDSLSSQGGLSSVSEISRVVNVFGDVQSNDQVQAFDASRLLAIAVGLGGANTQTTLVGDVDGSGDILAFDASLVLQYVVRLIDRFPVQTDTDISLPSDPKNHPFLKPVVGDVMVLGEVRPDGNGSYLVPVQLTEREGVLSGTLTFGVEAGLDVVDVLPANGYGGFMTAHNVTAEGVKVAFAGSRSEQTGTGEVLLLLVRGEEGAPVRLSLDHVILNGESLTTPIQVTERDAVVPSSTDWITALHQNLPNPFNPQTTIRYSIAEASDVHVAIYSVTGQVVRTLVREYQNAGAYEVVWDGKNVLGRQVGSGVYLMRMQTGQFDETRKIVLMR